MRVCRPFKAGTSCTIKLESAGSSARPSRYSRTLVKPGIGNGCALYGARHQVGTGGGGVLLSSFLLLAGHFSGDWIRARFVLAAPFGWIECAASLPASLNAASGPGHARQVLCMHAHIHTSVHTHAPLSNVARFIARGAVSTTPLSPQCVRARRRKRGFGCMHHVLCVRQRRMRGLKHPPSPLPSASLHAAHARSLSLCACVFVCVRESTRLCIKSVCVCTLLTHTNIYTRHTRTHLLHASCSTSTFRHRDGAESWGSSDA